MEKHTDLSCDLQNHKQKVLKHSFKHSGNLGDLIYSLPVVRFYGGGKLHLNASGLTSKKYDGTVNGLNQELINLIKPLLEKQEYISSVINWNDDVVDFDLDLFREKDLQRENLCEKILASFEVPFEEVKKPWITCDKKSIAPVVVSRSTRYRNSNLIYNHVLQDFADCVFLGLPEEHRDFENKFGEIRYHAVQNFLEMAEIINGSELFVGNQSFGMSLAIALNKTYLQEYCPIYHDCIFDRTNGHYIYVRKDNAGI